MSGIPSPLKSPTAMVYPWLDSDCLARVSNCAHVGTADPTTANNAPKAHSRRRRLKRYRGLMAILTSLLQMVLRAGGASNSAKAYHDIQTSPSSLSSPLRT